MAKTIPEDIMATAVRLYDGIRDCFDVYHYDEGEYGCSYGIEVEDVDVRNIIARALLAERERCAKIAADVLASNNDVDSWDDGYRVAAEEILDAIRTPSTGEE